LLAFKAESLTTELLFLFYSSVRLTTGMWFVAVLLAGTNALVVVRGKGVEVAKGIGFCIGICCCICVPLKLNTGA